MDHGNFVFFLKVVPSKSFIQNADAVDGHEGRLKHAIYGILKDG